jgi:GTP-binding protein EngB required for normal cell division
MYNYIISSKKPFIIIANKSDKIAPTKVESTTKNLQKEINPLCDSIMLPFSSEKKIYCDSVWEILENYIT